MKLYQCIKCGKICFELFETTKHRHQYEGHAFREINAIHLPLKAKWYDMIESGEKKEEYRLMSPHWLKALCGIRHVVRCKKDSLMCGGCVKNDTYLVESFDAVVFRYGYTKRIMVWSVESISIGQGRSEWGAPQGRDVFVIRLKERLF